MRETPIIFNTPMVRAVLSGLKTQTRRPVSQKVLDTYEECLDWARSVSPRDVSTSIMSELEAYTKASRYKFGDVGDRLWVRETFIYPDAGYLPTTYKADDESYADRWGLKWKPSIHMPRYFSRINLEITSLRAERLCSITEQDAKAEGVDPSIVGDLYNDLKYRAGFETQWDLIYGQGNFSENPWVWVIEFKKLEEK